MVFEPDEHTALNHYAWTRDRLLIVTLADVASRVEIVTPGSWQREPVAGHPGRDQHRHRRRRRHRRRVLPRLQRIRHAVAAACAAPVTGNSTQIKSAPAFFDAENITVTQYFVASKDGTSIPYFVVRPDRRATVPAPPC